MKPVPPEVQEIVDELSKRLDDLANQTAIAIEACDWQRVYALHRFAEGMNEALCTIWRMYRIGIYAREDVEKE